MIIIKCPFCGSTGHNEFKYGGDGSIKYPDLHAPIPDWHDAVFQRKNIAGIQTETWQHIHGCRMWLLVDRDTLTHKIISVRPANPNIINILEKNS